VALGVVAVVTLRLHRYAPVYAHPSRQSEFIRTYDPSTVIAKFGGFRHSTGSSGTAPGRRGVWNTREYLVWVAVGGGRVPNLLAALHHQADQSISGAGSRIKDIHTPGAGSPALGPQAVYETRYEDSHADGVVRIGPAYPDTPSTACSTATFAAQIRIDEHWLPD